MKNKLILSLGSNIEPRLDYLKEAILLLNAEFKFIRVSSVYETGPVDYLKQDDFYNICAEYETGADDPFELLKITKEIEKKIGRGKSIDKGPRKIDIDIIFFGNHSENTEVLMIPHKEMLKRKFVLEPLLEILPEDSEYIEKYDLVNINSGISDQKTIKIGEFKLGKQ
jgi:2-amino-4-hydroxy-6-hydroxymethyldihydropteridine diphosphokinase